MSKKKKSNKSKNHVKKKQTTLQQITVEKEAPQQQKFFPPSKQMWVKALSAMAQGLFASLLIGTMISTFGEQFHIPVLVEIGTHAKGATGYAMAVAIGYALSASPLVIFSLATVGGISNSLGGAGGPFAVLIITILATWAGGLVSQKTKFDIIITPLVTVVVGCGLAILLAPSIGNVASSIGKTILWATELQPFFMGIFLSVVMGIVLTLPISSAAICAGLGLTGLAGGAALAGCCAQMVGFATMSFRENGVAGLFSQGIGTSMLQMGNIIRNPKIWIPPILTSAVTGPLATVVFNMEMHGAAIASGMGTCGFVGQIGLYTGWVEQISLGAKTSITSMDLAGMVLICFVIPAILTPIFANVMRKMGYIKEGDLKLD